MASNRDDACELETAEILGVPRSLARDDKQDRGDRQARGLNSQN